MDGGGPLGWQWASSGLVVKSGEQTVQRVGRFRG
jgi:hypothetical protein